MDTSPATLAAAITDHESAPAIMPAEIDLEIDAILIDGNPRQTFDDDYIAGRFYGGDAEYGNGRGYRMLMRDLAALRSAATAIARANLNTEAMEAA